jgi:transposase
MVESRRSVGYVVTEMALRLGLEVFSSGTHALEEFRDKEGQPRKSDERDAYLLARIGYLGYGVARRVLEITAEELELGRLVRWRQRLTEDHTRLLDRLRCLLLELSPALVSASAPKWSSQRVRRVLERWPALLGLERARSRTVEGELIGGRLAKRRAEARFLQQAAREVVMGEAERAILAEELGDLLAQLARLEVSMRSVDQRIEERLTQHPEGGKLLEVPGIGPFVAAVLVAELLPLARHSTEAQAATYSGVTPLCRSSGRQERSHLGRRTNKRILRALYLSAIASTRVSALDRDYYQRKREQFQGHPKPHVKATLSLARQRSRVIYKLLTTEERYEKETLIRSHLERRRAA